MDKVPLTIKGYAALEEELKQRQQVERPRIIQAISEARALGDLSENAEYHAAKEAQSLNEGRILELESLISRAEVIDVTKLSGNRIKFGATVKLVDEDTEEEKTYQIVGEPEADVRSGRVSVTLPDRPRPDGQDRRRHRRGHDAGRRQVLRGGRRPVRVDGGLQAERAIFARPPDRRVHGRGLNRQPRLLRRASVDVSHSWSAIATGPRSRDIVHGAMT